MVRSQNGHEMTVNIEGLFTSSIGIHSYVAASVDAWKEYTAWFQLHHSHQASESVSKLASKFKSVLDRFKSVKADARCKHGLTIGAR